MTSTEFSSYDLKFRNITQIILSIGMPRTQECYPVEGVARGGPQRIRSHRRSESLYRSLLSTHATVRVSKRCARVNHQD